MPISINIYTHIYPLIGMKVKRSISIDREVDEALKRKPWINVSALVNRDLKKHLEENVKS